MVEGGIAFTAGFLRQGAGQIRFADAGGAGDQDIQMVGDPLAGGQLMDQGAVQVAGCFQVQVFEAGLEFQLSGPQSGREATVLALTDFPVEEQPQAFQEAQPVALRLLFLVLQGVQHAAELQGAQVIEGGMGQHDSGLRVQWK